MTLFLIRHGEILSNIRKIYAGKSPEPLTERGRKQAYETAERLKSIHIDSIYTSPIKRAVETAEIIGSVIGKDYLIVDEFREMEMGPWEGMSEEEIARQYPQEWDVWLRSPAELRLEGRETLNELLGRVLDGVKKVAYNHTNKDITIITHVAIIRVLYLWHNKMDLNLYKTIRVNNGEVFNLRLTPLELSSI
jgi:alpha-ribazole phosphatase/probable phosphoglycerate mutase